MEANRTPGLVLLDSLASTQADLENFEQVLMPVVGLASLAPEGLEQEGLVADEVGAEGIVEQLELGIVDYSVAVVAVEQPFAVKLVGFVLGVDIAEETSDYFAGALSDFGVD